MRRTLAALMAVGIIFGLSACVSSSEAATEKTKAPTSLIGEWSQTSKSKTGTYATATVYNGAIQVNIQTHDANNLYWLGTFLQSSEPPTDHFTVDSKGDPDAMDQSLFGSNSSRKTFTYHRNGTLSYKFSLFNGGITETVVLMKRPDDNNIATPSYDVPSTLKPTKSVRTPALPQKTSKPVAPAAPPAIKAPPVVKAPAPAAKAPAAGRR